MDALPGWVDRQAFPFARHYFEVDGHRLHYVDEGHGPTVLLVHGTPSWSWEWRHVIKDLARDHRVLCLDMLGFGLSDQVPDAAYRPADHTRRLHGFVDGLDLQDITLAVHDYGGPIGLGWAVDHPGRVRKLLLTNTFAWSDKGLGRVGGFFGTWLGRMLYLRFNISPRFIAPMAWGDRKKLTPDIQRHYLGPFPTPASRIPLWWLAKELRGSAEWFDSVAGRLDVLRVPTAMVWGMKDPAFGPPFLARWRTLFPEARVTPLAGVGHFPQEEAPEAVIAALRAL
jgi:pimeloyl-ACP methyl ester carboxylesterase